MRNDSKQRMERAVGLWAAGLILGAQAIACGSSGSSGTATTNGTNTASGQGSGGLSSTAHGSQSASNESSGGGGSNSGGSTAAGGTSTEGTSQAGTSTEGTSQSGASSTSASSGSSSSLVFTTSDGGTGCTPTTCPSPKVCVESDTNGGAVNFPDDAGNCPADYYLSGSHCLHDPSTACTSLPAGCDGGLTYACGKSFCGNSPATMCTDGTGYSITCSFDAP